MEQVNRICRHPLWRESMEQIRQLEQDRIFCRHDIAHCLDVASAELARSILTDCGYSPAEQEEIVSAILQHRLPKTGAQNDLAGLLFRADKASRLCMFCGAAEVCNWSQEKKNMNLKY